MPGIKEVEVRITNKCNALCAHCGVNSAPTQGKALTLNIAKCFLDAFIERWGAPAAWKLTGGEPMLYPELVCDLAELATARESECRLVTNAFWATTPDRTTKAVEQLVSAGIEHFWISTDSFHNKFVPLARTQNLVAVLQDIDKPFYINFCYVYPQEDLLGDRGVPRIEPGIDCDAETLRLHKRVSKVVRHGQHGWQVVLDRGRGKQLIDSLGDHALRVREKLDNLLKQLGASQDLELLWNGDVLYDWRRLGNVVSDRFPGFLDSLGA